MIGRANLELRFFPGDFTVSFELFFLLKYDINTALHSEMFQNTVSSLSNHLHK